MDLPAHTVAAMRDLGIPLFATTPEISMSQAEAVRPMTPAEIVAFDASKSWTLLHSAHVTDPAAFGKAAAAVYTAALDALSEKKAS